MRLIRSGDAVGRSVHSMRSIAGSLFTVTLVIAMNSIAASGREADNVSPGLAGHWTFDDGTGKDVSGHGGDAVLNSSQIYSLGQGRACVRFQPGAGAVRIPVKPNSPLAIGHGTVAMWLNVAWTDTVNILAYDNQAIQLNVYRGYLQPRFRGEGRFKYSSNAIDLDWPKYDMREWAFYPHERTAVGDSDWHHFVVSYDEGSKQIVGWRDGLQIATIDLSKTPMEPLRHADFRK